MRPHLRFLDDALVSRILDEARDLLATIGVEVHNDAATELLLADTGPARTSGAASG